VAFQSKLNNLTITQNISKYTNPTAAGSAALGDIKTQSSRSNKPQQQQQHQQQQQKQQKTQQPGKHHKFVEAASVNLLVGTCINLFPAQHCCFIFFISVCMLITVPATT
jgi:hypothetical protein